MFSKRSMFRSIVPAGVIFACMVIITLTPFHSFSQSTGSAYVSARIITPIGISKNADMNFGNLSVGSSGGFVVLDPTGSRNPTGSVVLPSTTGTVTAASFTIQGTPNYSFSITLPASDVTQASNVYLMTAGAFTSNPGPTGMLNGNGQQTLTIGATLTVSGNQEPGDYITPSPFNIIVNYN